MENLIQLLELLQSGESYSIQNFMKHLSFSESKVRVMIKELRTIGKEHGFTIKHIAKEGYVLDICDRNTYDIYLEHVHDFSDNNVSSKQYRIFFILYMLYKSQKYITLQEVADTLDVSRKTILNDMDDVKEHSRHYHVEVEAKSHYGIRLTGSELQLRKLFKDITMKISKMDKRIQYLLVHEEDSQFEQVRKCFLSMLHEENVLLTKNAIESVLFHLKILIYRLQNGNYIEEVNFDDDSIDEGSKYLAYEITKCISDIYAVNIGKEEIMLVASQIFGKKVVHEVSDDVKEKQTINIYNTLQQIDKEYGTDCIKDEVLKEGLLLHTYPLVMRLSFGLSLSNSLIRHLPAQYTYSFILALKFSEYHPELKKFSFSRDEIGYLALHFATYYERKHLEMMKQIRNILLIHENMRNESILLKIKLQQIFPNASIKLKAKEQLEQYQVSDVHLIVSTCEIPEYGIVHVKISSDLNEEDIQNIRSMILFNYDYIQNKVLEVENLFKEDLFFHSDHENYMELIESYCLKMEQLHYAKSGYADSVLVREQRLDTIYENGVCAPHSLSALAEIDSIAVVILKKPIYYENKKVAFIFLLNLQQGHMFLHQEISQFLLRLMQNETVLNKIKDARTWNEFKLYIR